MIKYHKNWSDDIIFNITLLTRNFIVTKSNYLQLETLWYSGRREDLVVNFSTVTGPIHFIT